MRFHDVLTTAITQIRANKLRSFFTLLGIIVSVAFLVAVVAVIQGMNAYVSENLAGALIGQNTFQVRRSPIQLGLFDDEEFLRIQKRPRITETDAQAVMAAIPNAVAVSIQSGWPTPIADVLYADKTLGDVAIFGIRIPIVPGLNDDAESIRQLAEFIAALPRRHRIELLPYHHIAVDKYLRLGKTYRLFEVRRPDDDRMKDIARQLQQFELPVTVGG